MSRFTVQDPYSLSYTFSNEDIRDEYQALIELLITTIESEDIDEFNQNLGALNSTICTVRMSPWLEIDLEEESGD
jgi:hypothetical protein